MDTMLRIAGLIPQSILWIMGVCIIAILVHGVVATRKRELRLMLCGVALMILLTAPLSRITADASVSLHDSLTPLAGSRYWFIPALALKYQLAFTAWRTAFRPAKWLVAICIAYGMIVDYHVGGLPNETILAGVAAYDEAPSGRVVTVPIWPPGWSTAIVKR